VASTRSYKEYLEGQLEDPREAAAYLNAALDDDDARLFLVALRNVVDAQGGMTRLAEEAQLSRGTLYRTLSTEGNPRLSSLEAVLSAVDLRFCIESADEKCSRSKKAATRKTSRKGSAGRRPRAR